MSHFDAHKAMKLCVPIAQAATRFDSLDMSTERLACGRGGGQVTVTRQMTQATHDRRGVCAALSTSIFGQQLCKQQLTMSHLLAWIESHYYIKVHTMHAIFSF